MYRVSTEMRFRARHWLALPKFQEEPHEHDWRVRASVAAEELDRHGLVMDFNRLQQALGQAVGPLVQAGCVNDLWVFGGKNPSTEHLAEYIFEEVAKLLPGRVRLVEVTLWETAESCATYGT